METTAKNKPNVQIAPDPETLARRAVQLFVSLAHEAIASHGSFFVALSGGHTPRHFFELLVLSPDAKSLPWDRVHVFWVDERYVPPDSARSNYKLAADAFLGRVDIPPENIHRIPTEHEDINAAARAYEQTIRSVFGLYGKEMPQFDLIVLGMGVDGHTGSLLPNSYATFDVNDLACVVFVMDDTLNRITLTHPVLLAARRIAVLVCGEEKADTLKQVLTGEPDEVKYPIQVLWPALDKITWLVDRAAARAL